MASSAVEKDGWLQAIRACMRDLSLNAEGWEKMRGGQASSTRVIVAHLCSVGKSWSIVWSVAHVGATWVLSDPCMHTFIFVKVCSCNVLHMSVAWRFVYDGTYVKCMVDDEALGLSSKCTRNTFRYPYHGWKIATILKLSCRCNSSCWTL